MRRATKGYSGVVTPLFDTMLVQPQGEAPSTSPSRITSSPSLPSHHTSSSTPTTPPSTYHLHEAEAPATMPHKSPLHSVHSHGSDEEDPSKQGRKIAQIDTDPTISLVQEKGTLWFQEHTEIQDKTSADTEVLVQEDPLTELVEDVRSGGKGDKEVSTANVPVSTAGAE
ncbi:hypothetical protein Tco_0099054, partial [Tanacetum coccineum]